MAAGVYNFLSIHSLAKYINININIKELYYDMMFACICALFVVVVVEVARARARN